MNCQESLAMEILSANLSRDSFFHAKFIILSLTIELSREEEKREKRYFC